MTLLTYLKSSWSPLSIKACLANYEFDAPKRDKDFEESVKDLTNEELYAKLFDLDPKACEKIHPNNRHRALRALHQALNNDLISTKNHKDEMLYDAYIIYLNVERSLLYERINARVDIMFDDGLVEEVAKLYQKGYLSRFHWLGW